MCKHILINEFSREDLQVVNQFISKTYDKDGFGAIIRTKDSKIETFKSLNQNYFYLELMYRLGQGNVDSLVIHHRTSTNKTGIDYAHPFNYKGYYMTHNGVVTVPKWNEYKTNTENDSEKLLHHFVETNYNTEDVSGYFSVFMVKPDYIRVIVDGTAPMYTDGRVYSSHKLYDTYAKVEMKHIVINRDGTSSFAPITVKKTDYGMDRAHLSLGSKSKKTYSWNSYDDYNRYYTNTPVTDVDDFMYFISDSDFEYVLMQKNRGDTCIAIRQLAEYYGMKLSKKDIKSIANLFDNERVAYGKDDDNTFYLDKKKVM